MKRILALFLVATLLLATCFTAAFATGDESVDAPDENLYWGAETEIETPPGLVDPDDSMSDDNDEAEAGTEIEIPSDLVDPDDSEFCDEAEAAAEAVVTSGIIVPFSGNLIPASAFTQYDVTLYWGGVPLSLTGVDFRAGNYRLSVDFALANGTVVNAGDYFEIDMTISGANFTTPAGTIVLGEGDLSVEIIHTPPSQNLTLRIIFNNDMAAHTNITGRANITVGINIADPGPVYWSVSGPSGATGGENWGGTGTPTAGPRPGFNNNGSGWNKGTVHSNRNIGMFEWQVGINNNGSPASHFFSERGFTTLPQYVRITDTLTGPHTLVPWSTALSDVNPSPDRILDGYVVLSAVNIAELWRLFNDAALDPAVEAELRTVPWLSLPADMSIYDPIQMDANGGFYTDTFLTGAINNRLRWNNNYFQSRPFIVANYPNLVRTLNVPVNLTADGFYIDVPTAFFDNAVITMRYQTRVLPGADPGEILRNSITLSGNGEEGGTRTGHAVWDGWSGVGADNTQIGILKQDPNNANANMAGAVFSVERQNGTFTAAQGANAQGIVQIATNAQGIASTVLGLGAFGPGEVFIIREVTAPSGYVLYSGDIRISIDPYNNHAVTLLNGYAGAPFSLDGATGRIVLNNHPFTADVTIGGTKTVALASGTTTAPDFAFGFTLTQLNSHNINDVLNGGITRTATANTTGAGNVNFSFPEITGLTVGTYYFRVVETTVGGLGWANDTAPRIVTVVVSDTLPNVTVTYTLGNATFTNTYETPVASATIAGTKRVVGATAPDFTFGFTLTQLASHNINDVLNGGITRTATANTTSAGDYAFSFELTGLTAGTYYFRVVETTVGGLGWMNDTAPRIVTVVVSGDPLTAEVTNWDGGTAIFTNSYDGGNTGGGNGGNGNGGSNGGNGGNGGGNGSNTGGGNGGYGWNPPPGGGGSHFVPDGDGRYIEVDDAGTPRGEWIWDDGEEVWTFIENTPVPLAASGVPQTGLSGIGLYVFMMAVSITGFTVLLFGRKRKVKTQP